MKKILFAFIAAILAAAQVMTPAAAAAECGTTYIVQPKDTLTKIAMLCNTTVDDILKRNPQITNPNVVYIGQVIRVSGSFSSPIATPRSSLTTYAARGTARVSISTERARAGEEVTVTVYGFPANASIDYRIGKEDKDYTAVYDGKVNSRGAARMKISIPTEAKRGEYWVIVVTTTSQNIGVEVTTRRIYIEG